MTAAPEQKTIAALPGDGIGPEIMDTAKEVLEVVAPGRLHYEDHLFGGASIDVHGIAMTDDVLAACKRADAVLLAAVGGPKWDTTDPDVRELGRVQQQQLRVERFGRRHLCRREHLPPLSRQVGKRGVPRALERTVGASWLSFFACEILLILAETFSFFETSPFDPPKAS